MSDVNKQLLEALKDLFASYKQLADSGDAGNWRIEDFPEGKQAIEAIAAADQAQQASSKCATCRGVGIVGHSDVCMDCIDTWQQGDFPAQQAEPLRIANPSPEQLYTMVTSRFKSGTFPWSMVSVSGKEAWAAAAAELVFAPDTIMANHEQPQSAQQRPCPYCNDTGDVHSITGEWRGVCSCEAGQAQADHIGDVNEMAQAEPVVRDVLSQLHKRPANGLSEGDYHCPCYLMGNLQFSCTAKQGISPKITRQKAAQQQAVPEGYALVPIEPTQAMLCAGQKEWLESAGADPSFDMYRSMLLAVQKGGK